MYKKLLLVVMSVIFLTVSSPLMAEAKKVRFAYSGSKYLPAYQPMKKACATITEKTNGRYEVKIYPGRQLGADKDMISLVKSGAVEIASTSLALLDAYTKSFNAWQMPFLIKDYDQLLKIYLSDFTRKYAEEGLDKVGVHFLAISENGQRGFANNVRPINSPEDMKGLRFRVAENKVHTDILTALGATAVPISYGEIYQSMKTGVIDGSEINATSASTEKLIEVISQFTMDGHFFWPGLIFCNKDFWNSISKEDQAIFNDAFTKFTVETVKRVEEKDMAAREKMKKKGIKIIYPDLAPFKEKMKFVYDTYMKDEKIASFVNFVRDTK
jgi:TRAP-type transport system periplasmic protein